MIEMKEFARGLGYTIREKLQHFTVFDVKGSVITRVDNYTIDGATASLILNPGVYLIKSDTKIKKFVK